MRCGTCHGKENLDEARLPGHPQWHLAPAEMAWEGKRLGEICEQIKDAGRNGGKTLDQIVDHMAHDDLVGWGWRPDKGRKLVPGNLGRLRRPHRGRAESGAVCPAT